MDAKSFWLISLDESYVSVSLISLEGNRYSVRAIGREFTWDHTSPNSLISAIDNSLSTGSSITNLPQDQEPNLAAFVLSPFWVGSDGKIVDSYLKLVETACRRLSLQPMGFIADDEAITEAANNEEGLAVNFILLHLNSESFNLSLVYLGKIKKRYRQNYQGQFHPSLLESALQQVSSGATLPPLIIIFGHFIESELKSIRDYPWIGRKDLETFLHFPDIKSYSLEDLINVYSKTVVSQINPEIIKQKSITPPADLLEEVSGSDLGFSSDTLPSSPVLQTKTAVKLPSIRLPSLPRIHFPRLRLKFPLFILGTLPVVVLIPFFFSTADITLFLSSYEFLKTSPIILDSNARDFDLTKGIIPVVKKNFTVTVSDSLKTTGRATVGEKAKGEIIIYNKQEKTFNLPAKTLIIDSSANKFELISSVAVPPSTYNLEQGIINLGQAKAAAGAVDIGPEFNIAKEAKLSFKDYSDFLLVRASQNFSGGTRRQVNVVSKEDKANLEQKINQKLEQSISLKDNQEIANLSGVLKETLQTKINHIEFNREVSEETDELQATANASLGVFVLDSSVKSRIINDFFTGNSLFSQSVIEPDNFNLAIKIDNLDSLQAKGILTLQGKALPKIDTSKLQHALSGKNKSATADIIKKFSDRIYNFRLDTNFKFLGNLNPMPFRPGRISINLLNEPL